jgi:hypothetical protein
MVMEIYKADYVKKIKKSLEFSNEYYDCTGSHFPNMTALLQNIVAAIEKAADSGLDKIMFSVLKTPVISASFEDRKLIIENVIANYFLLFKELFQKCGYDFHAIYQLVDGYNELVFEISWA